MYLRCKRDSCFSISQVSPFFAAANPNYLNKQLKIFLNYFVGPILFVWLSYSIYQQIQNQTDIHQSWDLFRSAFTGPQLVKLIVVLLLMLLNWGIEARKWQILVNPVEKVSYWRAYRAVLTGLALAFNSLNRIGESAGRAIFLQEGNRIRGIILSVVGTISQIIVTLFFGLLGLFYLRYQILDKLHPVEGLNIIWLDALIATITVGTLVLIMVFFRLSWLTNLLEKIPFVAKHKFFVQKLEDFHWKELTRILVLAFSRYLVFVWQYVLLFQVFNVDMNWMDASSIVCVLFLILAIVPTITLAELGFRGKVSVQLFGLLSSNTLGIVATAGGIWIINLIIPAIAGSVLILGIRLFRNK